MTHDSVCTCDVRQTTKSNNTTTRRRQTQKRKPQGKVTIAASTTLVLSSFDPVRCSISMPLLELSSRGALQDFLRSNVHGVVTFSAHWW